MIMIATSHDSVRRHDVRVTCFCFLSHHGVRDASSQSHIFYHASKKISRLINNADCSCLFYRVYTVWFFSTNKRSRGLRGCMCRDCVTYKVAFEECVFRCCATFCHVFISQQFLYTTRYFTHLHACTMSPINIWSSRNSHVCKYM